MADASIDTLAPLKLRAQHELLFPTPILQGSVPDSDALNRHLAQAVRARRDSADGLGRSNVGGWHSDTDMTGWGGTAALHLSDLAIRAARRMSHFDDRSPDSLRWWVRMWANVCPPGALNMSHAHPGVLWAAVYYVDDGCETGEVEGGELFLEDPRYPVPFLTFPGFRAMMPDGQPQSVEHRIRPRIGDLVVFPGYMRHGVRPHRGSRDRVSVAMNIYATPNG